jgi:hypothetical protein
MIDFNSTEIMGELERSESRWASISPEQKADLASCNDIDQVTLDNLQGGVVR